MSGETTEIPAPPAEPARGGLFSRRVALQTPKESLQPEAAPPPPSPPPSKRRPTLSALSGFFSFLLVLSLVLVGLGGYAQHEMRVPGPLENDKVVVIAPRTDVPEIIAQLENEGVIDNALLLNGALIVSGDRKRLRAGEFLFKARSSLRDVIDTLVSGREITHPITIPEGLTSEQIIERLKDNEFLTGDIRDIPKEGSLLPETYRVSRGMARANLIRLMQDDQKKALDQIWARRSPDLPLRSAFELLILASIVEKETGKADERPRVAGVFINRLQKRMKLQSDPTIVYGLVGGKGTLGRGILRSEVDKPTPYNTYAIEGLPPGPIANPGRAAMEAVANPSRTKDLYFVADGTGGHVFAETIDQHNKNVLRWRQIEKDKAAAAATGAPASGQAPSPDIDHAPPPATAPAAPLLRDQRGQNDGPAVPVFGALPRAFGRESSDALAFAQPSGAVVAPAEAIEKVISTPTPASSPPRSTAPAAPPPQPAASAAAPQKYLGAFALSGQIDQTIAAQLGMADAALDGPDTGPDSDVTDPNAYPVSPQRRADQKARAARYGVNAGDDTLAATGAAAQDIDRATPPDAAGGPRVIKVFDASEGTALDPLKDKSWDLNSAKTVPSLSLDPAAALRKPAAKPGKKTPVAQ